MKCEKRLGLIIWHSVVIIKLKIYELHYLCVLCLLSTLLSNSDYVHEEKLHS